MGDCCEKKNDYGIEKLTQRTIREGAGDHRASFMRTKQSP